MGSLPVFAGPLPTRSLDRPITWCRQSRTRCGSIAKEDDATRVDAQEEL